MSATHIQLSPRISEASFLQAKDGVYTFDVDLTVNKHEIKQAVEAQFDVTVVNVKTLVAKGKSKSSNRKRSQSQSGKRADRKKAYVTLKDGDTIKLFEENQ